MKRYADARDVITVYDRMGGKHTMPKRNAADMVAHHGWSYTESVPVVPEPEPVPEPVVVPVKVKPKPLGWDEKKALWAKEKGKKDKALRAKLIKKAERNGVEVNAAWPLSRLIEKVGE